MIKFYYNVHQSMGFMSMYNCDIPGRNFFKINQSQKASISYRFIKLLWYRIYFQSNSDRLDKTLTNDILCKY